MEGPQPRLDTNLTYSDGFTWVHGNHTLKFGFSYEQFRVHNPFDLYNNGYYSFNGGGQYSSGDPLIDFSLGVPDAYYQSNNGFIDAVASEEYAYGQDNWKATPDLTFNFGAAWDVEQPNSNRQDAGLGMICCGKQQHLFHRLPRRASGTQLPGRKRLQLGWRCDLPLRSRCAQGRLCLVALHRARPPSSASPAPTASPSAAVSASTSTAIRKSSPSRTSRIRRSCTSPRAPVMLVEPGLRQSVQRCHRRCRCF